MLPPHRMTPENLVLPEELESSDNSHCDMSGCEIARSPPPKLLQPGVEPVSHFDLVIIGAGPAALALISRILEARPAALYTEDEHRHLHFTHRQRKLTLLHSSSSSRRRRPRQQEDESLCGCDGKMKILVIDNLGEGFMGLWRRNFEALRISHLRSPMFFHPDASDFDALIAFANREGKAEEGTPDQVIESIECTVAGRSIIARSGRGYRKTPKEARSSSPADQQDAPLPDLIEILGVVGKEKSKHKRKQQHASTASSIKVHVNERDRRDYFTPSSSLFDSFTRRLEQRYSVQPCIDTWPKVSQLFCQDRPETISEDSARAEGTPVTTVKGTVKDLTYLDGVQQTVQDDFGNHSSGFLLRIDDGADSQPNKDESTVISAKAVVSAVGFGGIPNIPSYLSTKSACGPGWMHSSCLASQPFPLPSGKKKMVVVGGGLTSAQIVVRALEEGWHKVVLLTRGHLKSKPFDVDLGWVGRYSNYLKMQFWQNEDVQERLRMLREARNGGSVTPTYAKVLLRLQASGKVEIRTNTTIASADYIPTSTAEENGKGISNRQWDLELRSKSETDHVQADYIVVATGAEIDFGGLPFLQSLQKTHPIKLAGGLPVLTADLEYRRDVPLLITGAYAGLQIGPAAGNLGGMRDSADRIANRLLELLSVPESVNRRSEKTLDAVNEAERANVKTSERRPRMNTAETATTFTHFNFDLLSIEA